MAGKRRIAELVLPKSSSLSDLDTGQLRVALGIRPDSLLTEDLGAPSATDAATASDGAAPEPSADPDPDPDQSAEPELVSS